MTWKLYALSSSVAVLATVVLSSPAARRPLAPADAAQPARPSAAAVDLTGEAERLQSRLAETSSYDAPRRDAFRFADAPRRAPTATPLASAAESPIASVPVRPPFVLAGVAGRLVDGSMEYTAILSSPRGVDLVRSGDVVDRYRVASVSESEAVLEPLDQGPATTLRLATP